MFLFFLRIGSSVVCALGMMLTNNSFPFAGKVVEEPQARDPHHLSSIQFSEEALPELSLSMNKTR